MKFHLAFAAVLGTILLAILNLGWFARTPVSCDNSILDGGVL
jgi:hypothetical protein